MKSKAGFFFVLSCLFFFSACAEVKTSQQISNSELKKLAGQWDYSGYATSPGCIETVRGKFIISLDGSVQFLENDKGICPLKSLSWNLPNSGSGGIAIVLGQDGKIFIGQAIQTPNGVQPVNMIPVPGTHGRDFSLYAPIPGIPNSSFNAIAVRE